MLVVKLSVLYQKSEYFPLEVLYSHMYIVLVHFAVYAVLCLHMRTLFHVTQSYAHTISYIFWLASCCTIKDHNGKASLYVTVKRAALWKP